MDFGFFTSLFLSAAVSISPSSSSKKDALKVLGKAVYKSSHMDEKIKYYERRYLSDEARKYGGYVVTMARIIKDKRVSYEWTF